MHKILPVAAAAGVVAVAMAFTPLAMASATPGHAATASSKHYTLSVTGNGKHAAVVWTTLTVKKGSGSGATNPALHSIPRAHEPWTKHVKAGASLYEVAAVQTSGSRLSCTIRNTKGHVVTRSTSRGKNTIVTCIVTSDALLAGLGSGSGSGVTGSLIR